MTKATVFGLVKVRPTDTGSRAREWACYLRGAMTRIINAAGLALVRAYEGLRLDAYQDSGGVWTIGYGHTHCVKPGDRISAERAEHMLEADLMTVEAVVTRLVKMPLSDNQFSALVSFVFNVGEGQFAASTLLRKLNEGGYGLVQPGLVKRRAAEATLWSMT